MTTGYLFLLGALVGYGLLGILHKVADHPRCRPRIITMLLLLWGAILTGLYTWLVDPRGLHLPTKVLAVGAAAGVLSSLALFAFQASLRYGKISTSWLIINLCVSVPVIMSIVVYRERVTAGKAAGMLLVLAAILLLWWDKKKDLERSGAEAGGHPAGEPRPPQQPVAASSDMDFSHEGGAAGPRSRSPRRVGSSWMMRRRQCRCRRRRRRRGNRTRSGCR